MSGGEEQRLRIFVLNGPNLNLLGARQPDLYGNATLEDVQKMCRSRAEELGAEIEFRQTNSEGELIDWLQEAGSSAQGVVLNPAAFSHYSVGVRDAVAASELPVVEVHISNIYAREAFRQKSVVSPVARGVIAGLGVDGYALAIEALVGILNRRQ